MWTTERKYEAAVRAPEGRELWRPDSRLIERSGWRQLVTPSANGYLNEVSHCQVAPEDVERAIDEAIASFQAHGLATKWYVGPTTQPSDLGERLARRGFISWDVRAMGAETGRSLDAPSDVEVVEVSERNLDGYIDTMMKGWSTDDDQRGLERETYFGELSKRPQTAHFFVARLDGKDVGTAGLFLRKDYGYLVGGQVLESARGRGAYRALVAARLAFLHARGHGYAVTLAREATAAPLLERLGFETIFRCACYLLSQTWRSGSQPPRR
jgi:GNAT superfamily N-acetyltransferase